jgi:hypothetical protein
VRQLTLTLLSLIALAAMLFVPSARQAAACSCAGTQPTREFAEYVARHDLIVIGEVVSQGRVVGAFPTPLGATPDPAAPPPDTEALRHGTYRAIVNVERAYGRRAPREIEILTVDSGGCGYSEGLQESGRHFLALRENEDSGTYDASYCTSFRMFDTEAPGSDRQRDLAAFLELLAQTAPPVDVEGNGTSWWLIATYAAVGVLLLGSAVVFTRRSRN